MSERYTIVRTPSEQGNQQGLFGLPQSSIHSPSQQPAFNFSFSPQQGGSGNKDPKQYALDLQSLPLSTLADDRLSQAFKFGLLALKPDTHGKKKNK